MIWVNRAPYHPKQVYRAFIYIEDFYSLHMTEMLIKRLKQNCLHGQNLSPLLELPSFANKIILLQG